MAFRLGNQVVDGQHVPLHHLGRIQAGNDLLDVAQGMMFVAVHVVIVVEMRRLALMALVVVMVHVIVVVATGIPGSAFIQLGRIAATMPVIIARAFLRYAVHQHFHMRADDAALFRRLRPKRHARQAQMVQPTNETLPVAFRQKLRQSGRQHVARRTHAAAKIQYLHSTPFIWLIKLAE